MEVRIAVADPAGSPARSRRPTGSCSSASCSLLRLRGGDGVVGWGEAAPLEPYDGVSLEAVREALAAYEPILRDGDDLPGGALLDACRDAADLPQALAAVDLALWDRAGNREGRPVSELHHRRARPASVRVNATIAAEDRAGAAGGGRRGRARGLLVREGQGRPRRRRGARRRRARRGRPADGAAPRRQRRLGASTRRSRRSRRSRRPGSSSSRSRCTASRRCARCATASRCAWRWTRRPAEPGSLTASGRRRGLPEGLALRRHLGPARPGRARPRVGRRRLPLLDLRRAARDRGRGALRGRAAPERRVRARHARAVRRGARGPPGDGGRDRRARGARARRLTPGDRHSVALIAAATACGASRGRPWPAPGTTSSRAPGSAPARRRPRDV